MRAAAATLALVGLLAGCGGGERAISPDQARACLAEQHFRVMGGVRAAGDANAPDTELVVGGPEMSLFLAYYDEEARAERYAPQLERNAQRFHGRVERHGKLTIVWVHGVDSAESERVRRCVT